MNQGGAVTAAQFNHYVQGMQAALGGLHYRLLQIKQRVYEMDADRRLARAGRRARMPVEFRSQYGEDCAIWEMLGAPLNGFSIEVGRYEASRIYLHTDEHAAIRRATGLPVD